MTKEEFVNTVKIKFITAVDISVVCTEHFSFHDMRCISHRGKLCPFSRILNKDSYSWCHERILNYLKIKEKLDAWSNL